MLKVGLTGGIACGKSYTLREFHKLGVYPIDADKIAHEVIQPGQPAYDRIIEAFGKDILDSERRIDRKLLGATVFSNKEARLTLNSIVHPYVVEAEEHQLAALEYELSNLRPAMAMVDAALMVETGLYKKYDVLIVVYCHSEIQLRRLMWRDKIPFDEALLRIDSQMPLLEKVKYADYIIENSGKLSNTQEQIRQTFAELTTRHEEGWSPR